MNLIPNWNTETFWEQFKKYFWKKENGDFENEIGLAVDAIGIKRVLRKIWLKWKKY